MSDLSERNTLLVDKLMLNAGADIVFGLFLILNLTASPISINFNPKVLVLLQVVVNFEGQIMVLISEENFKQLFISH